MTQNVSQWLDEIKTLRQRLTEAQQEREQAYESAINWQRLYETEAQQRRLESDLARHTIATLQQELQQLKTTLFAEGSGAAVARIETTVGLVKTEAELRSRLVQALAECDRLTKALQTEQDNHGQTRKSLTTALGDAIDALKGKGKRSEDG